MSGSSPLQRAGQVRCNAPLLLFFFSAGAKVAQVCLEGDTERTQTAANNKAPSGRRPLQTRRHRADLDRCNEYQADQDGCSAARTKQAILRDPVVAAQPPALKLLKGTRLSSEDEDEGAKGSAAVAKALRLK